jgi:hypothetical protein
VFLPAFSSRSLSTNLSALLRASRYALNRYPWAQIEAAAMLHFCLVDQNHFSRVISSMDPGDKDNVLHRVTTEKHRRNSHRPKTSMKYAQSPLSNSEVNAASNETTSSPPQPPIPSPDNKHPSPPPQQQPDRPPSPSEGVSPGKPDI